MTTRRNLLIGSGLVAAGAASGAWWWLRPAANPSGLGADVDRWLQGLAGSGSLGEALLASQPGLALDLAAAAAALRERLSLPAGEIDAALLRERLREAIAADFASGDVVVHEGWRLSRSEALLAVLRYRVAGTTDVAAAPAEGTIAQLEDWGPRRTVVGRKVNEQSDGHSGMWFRMRGVPPWAWVAVDGKRMPTQVYEDLVTSGLFDPVQARVLSAPGSYPVTLHDDTRGVWQLLGHFEVVPKPPAHRYPDGTESAAFCEITQWGPDRSRGNEGNPQSEGRLGLWIRSPCIPPHARVVVDGEELRSAPQGELITAMLPAERLSPPGPRRIQLRDPDSGETIDVGTMEILAPE